MEDDRSRENPRPSVVSSSSAPILERFRALVRDDGGIGGGVVAVYEDLLNDLTFNSKPVITELTIIAGDQREHAEGIADAICARILEVPVDQKLPSLYLLDSIVKNIGCEYVRFFASRLPKVFCEAYNEVHSSLHPSMRHLFRTWSKVFHPSVLRKIEDELQFSTTENQQSAALAKMRNSESVSPRPSHGIHVNPKYLEARRQLQNSAAMGVVDTQNNAQASDFEEDAVNTLAPESLKGRSGASPKFHDVGQATGNSSSLNGYRQRSSIQYDDYDYDRPVMLPPHLGRSKAVSPRSVRVSAIAGDEEPTHLVEVKVPDPLSSGLRRRSTSPDDDKFPRDSSPWGVSERTSSPHSQLGFGPSRAAIHQNGRLERSWPLDGGARQLEASTAYACDNGYRKKHLRELIDAYGNYRGESNSLEKLPKVQRINVNGMGREVVTKNWRSSEEEEYVWEDMSPTLADQSRRNSPLPFGPSSGSLSRRIALSRPDVSILEPDLDRSGWPGQTKRQPVDAAAILVDDGIPVLGSLHRSMNRKFPDGTGSSFHHYHHVQEPHKFLHSYQHELNSRPQGLGPLVPFSSSGLTLPNGQKVPGSYDYSPDVEMPFQRLSSIRSNSLNVEASSIDKHMAIKPLPPPSPLIWPPVHKSQPLPLHPIPSNQMHHKGPFSFTEANNPMVNYGPTSSVFLPQQQFDDADRKTSISSKVLPLPHQQPGLVHANRQSQEQGTGTVLQPHEAHGGYVPPVPAHVSSYLLAPHLNHLQMQGRGVFMGSVLPNSLPAMATSVATHSASDASPVLHGGILPPLPPGPPPAVSQIGSTSQCTNSVVSSSPASSFSGLISTLMAQGLISLTPPAQSEGSVGPEFNAELLKVRHESVINALYANLPRQCTTCGLRFTCQEEHSNHMDWHVTKNRVSKNRKQKPSRKWFVNAKEWLSGTETVGTDVVPGFLPAETASEKNEEKEMAVPADENQTVCALCGEPFEDFYSDEAEEWMYKGAVYLNATDGHIEGLDRSQWGPIVHAKCRPESSEGS
ncbi:uncharacterized protein M6B38_119465 [Iris pallida]|uniref:CID domain-containing protein n=1 Tax=Iris pallida TaxID=29817 RepID=A0AAX6H923_IRIPA|nr:uncharacterized protein M6B38_119465 [Iris pallida]